MYFYLFHQKPTMQTIPVTYPRWKHFRVSRHKGCLIKMIYSEFQVQIKFPFFLSHRPNLHETSLPMRKSTFANISYLIKGGTLDIVIILAHVERGSTGVNKPHNWLPFSTTLFALSNIPKNNTIALFILEAAKTHVCPTTLATAKLLSSTPLPLL